MVLLRGMRYRPRAASARDAESVLQCFAAQGVALATDSRVNHIDPALLTIAWAAAAGLLAQVLGHWWKVPAIVPLLLFGVGLGPAGLDVVRPDALGSGLGVIVKLAVSVILFEGALTLRLADLKVARAEVRNLVTVGALITWIGATAAAVFVAGLSLPVAIVFGALMTVTGPTVVQPLLRRVPLPRRVKTVLEGEAILIDPIGAVLAVAVFDVILGVAGVSPMTLFGGVWAYVGRLVIGAAIGVVGAVVVSLLLRQKRLVPPELANLVTLAGVWAVVGAAEWAQSEAGIMAAVAMGLGMQRGAVPEERRLRRFKEQLTVLGISLLFVLLSAQLPLGVVRAEGWRGFLTVTALMLVVRPLSVAVALRRSALTWRERVFVSWIAPRGIVAASVASVFALVLRDAGFSEGNRVLAITFMTIALTVTIQGLTAGLVARLLGLSSLAGRRVMIVGAGPLGRGLGAVLAERGRPVTLIDRNEALVAHAVAEGFEALAGNALDEDVLERAGAHETETVVAVTTNAEVNALATHLAHDVFGVPRSYPTLNHESRGAGPRLLDRVGGRIAFGRAVDVRAWDLALEAGEARFVAYRLPADAIGRLHLHELPAEMVAVVGVRGRSVEVVNADHAWRAGDEVVVMSRLTSDEATRALDILTGAMRRRTSESPTPIGGSSPA